MRKEEIGKGYHLLAKPAGPLCNLDCTYCFYTEKMALYEEVGHKFQMDNEVLDDFIRHYIQSQQIPEIQFVWQGGEPTILGVDYYKKILKIQQRYANGKRIVNILQTNGTLLDEEWFQFLKGNRFLVGISIDGPKFIHDTYRLNRQGTGTYDAVLNTISHLIKYDIPYNVLICVSQASSAYGIEVYNELKRCGVKHMQFTPIVERLPDKEAKDIGFKHATPSSIDDEGQGMRVTPFSVRRGAYGDFLIEIFEEWVRNDVGEIFVSNFEWALQSWMGLPSTVCIFSEKCGRALAIEHTGDVYACDHFVFPEYHLGNIQDGSILDIVNSERMIEFGERKKGTLPLVCQQCEVNFACQGECPRHRFDRTSSGETGLSYLCADYKKFFTHIHRYMKVLVQLIENGLPASDIMDVIEGPIAIVLD